MRAERGPYLHALIELVESKKALSPLKEVETLLQIISKSSYLSSYLHHPIIGEREKVEVLEEILGDLSPLLKVSLSLLWERGEESLLLPTLEGFCQYLKERERVEIRVISYSPLHRDHLKRIWLLLERRLERRVELVTEVDPHLLGGLVLEIDGRVIHGSLKQRLKSIRRGLWS